MTQRSGRYRTGNPAIDNNTVKWQGGVAGVPPHLGGAGGPVGAMPYRSMVPAVGSLSGRDLDLIPDRESIGGGLRAVGQFAKDYGPLVLSGLGMYEGWQQNKKAEEMMEKAIAAEERRRADVMAGIERRRAMETPDLSSTFESDNPYRRRIRSVGSGGY